MNRRWATAERDIYPPERDALRAIAPEERRVISSSGTGESRAVRGDRPTKPPTKPTATIRRRPTI